MNEKNFKKTTIEQAKHTDNNYYPVKRSRMITRTLLFVSTFCSAIITGFIFSSFIYS